jgi:tyrosine-protein kinase Etk/Wzc
MAVERTASTGGAGLPETAPPAHGAGRRRKGTFPPELWSRLGEEFRCLRTRVVGALGEERHKLILVTSAVTQEGKSSVSANLARSLALGGRATLLVDTDLRRPTVHSLFGVQRVGGLADVARGDATIDDVLVSTDLPELDLLTAGSPVDAPVELISSPGFSDAIRQLVGRYEYVVMDTPPLISIADTSVLARSADGIIVVVGCFSTPRELVKTALEQLHDLPVLGLVLNGISTPTSYYSYY